MLICVGIILFLAAFSFTKVDCTHPCASWSTHAMMPRIRYVGLIIVCCGGIGSAETLTVSGKGQAPVPVANKKDMPAANQQAVVAAQQCALADAVAQALFQVYGNRQKLGAQADSVIRDVVDHSAAMILDTQVKSVDIQAGIAVSRSRARRLTARRCATILNIR